MLVMEFDCDDCGQRPEFGCFEVVDGKRVPIVGYHPARMRAYREWEGSQGGLMMRVVAAREFINRTAPAEPHAKKMEMAAFLNLFHSEKTKDEIRAITNDWTPETVRRARRLPIE